MKAMLYNVLVVDDDKRTAQGLAAMIGVLGHTVGIAYGPRMAMQQLNEVIPDIIFLDVNMPGIDGIEVLRYLRRDPYTAKVPVVIVSANDSEQDKAQAFEAGANDYLIKPPTIEDIEVTLEKTLKKPAQPQAEPAPKATPAAQIPANNATKSKQAKSGKAVTPKTTTAKPKKATRAAQTAPPQKKTVL